MSSSSTRPPDDERTALGGPTSERVPAGGRDHDGRADDDHHMADHPMDGDDRRGGDGAGKTEAEHQTRSDTTKPMGRRDAEVADTAGASTDDR